MPHGLQLTLITEYHTDNSNQKKNFVLLVHEMMAHIPHVVKQLT